MPQRAGGRHTAALLPAAMAAGRWTLCSCWAPVAQHIVFPLRAHPAQRLREAVSQAQLKVEGWKVLTFCSIFFAATSPCCCASAFSTLLEHPRIPVPPELDNPALCRVSPLADWRIRRCRTNVLKWNAKMRHLRWNGTWFNADGRCSPRQCMIHPPSGRKSRSTHDGTRRGRSRRRQSRTAAPFQRPGGNRGAEHHHG